MSQAVAYVCMESHVIIQWSLMPYTVKISTLQRSILMDRDESYL